MGASCKPEFRSNSDAIKDAESSGAWHTPIELSAEKEGRVIWLLEHWKYIAAAWVAVTAVLAILIIYRDVLATRENDELLLTDEERRLLISEQKAILHKERRLNPAIASFAVLSGALLMMGYAIWAWHAFHPL